jgi:outer membrane lipoprotein-sorting protein
MILTTLTTIALGTFNSKDIDAYTQSGLKDLSFTVRIVQSSLKEASKIDVDYKKQFAFQGARAQLKEPFKLRIDAKVDDTQILYILNGTRQVTRIPKLKLNQRADLATEPGRRQTFMDFGVLTPSVIKSFFIPKFVRFDRETNNPVFDLTWPEKWDNPGRMRVWIDKDAKYIVKREWYGLEGQLKATHYYSSPMREGTVTFPTEAKVFNAENKLAASFKYESVKINDGLTDSLFDL